MHFKWLTQCLEHSKCLSRDSYHLVKVPMLGQTQKRVSLGRISLPFKLFHICYHLGTIFFLTVLS